MLKSHRKRSVLQSNENGLPLDDWVHQQPETFYRNGIERSISQLEHILTIKEINFEVI